MNPRAACRRLDALAATAAAALDDLHRALVEDGERLQSPHIANARGAVARSHRELTDTREAIAQLGRADARGRHPSTRGRA